MFSSGSQNVSDKTAEECPNSNSGSHHQRTVPILRIRIHRDSKDFVQQCRLRVRFWSRLHCNLNSTSCKSLFVNPNRCRHILLSRALRLKNGLQTVLFIISRGSFLECAYSASFRKKAVTSIVASKLLHRFKRKNDVSF